MKVYYTVYKITNTINGKIYIGAHKTSDLEDKYMGSGKVIKLAIKKHGLVNFTKEYLHIFNNHEDMFKMETVLVNEDFVLRKDTYNLTQGGYGGFYYVNETGMNYLHDNRFNSIENLKLGTPAFVEKCKTDEDFYNKVINHMNYMKNLQEEMYPNGTFKDKNHSEESIEKMKETHKKNEHQKGFKNSQYGTMWIYNLEEKLSKKIKKEEFPNYEKDGWLKGRKIKF